MPCKTGNFPLQFSITVIPIPFWDTATHKQFQWHKVGVKIFQITFWWLSDQFFANLKKREQPSSVMHLRNISSAAFLINARQKRKKNPTNRFLWKVLLKNFARLSIRNIEFKLNYLRFHLFLHQDIIIH